MKPIDETWEAYGCCVTIEGASEICSFYEVHDRAAMERARLAAQAPAMARALLEVLTPEGINPYNIRCILRDAGVIE